MSNAFFQPGIPIEDSHAWKNDCCFLTRLADEASERYNTSSASTRNDLANGASLAQLSCVARVVSDEDEQASKLMPRLSFLGRIGQSISRGTKKLLHSWWHPNEVSASLVAQYAESMDLSTVPIEQLRIALLETINTGDEFGAANLAAELARRREPPQQQVNTTSGIISASPSASRAPSVNNNNNNNQRNSHNDENVVVGSLWGRPSDHSNGWGGSNRGSGGNNKPMWS